MDFGEKPKRRIYINITSLVDILIVLLMFFMLTTQFIRMEALNLSLMGSGGADLQGAKEEKPVVITLIGSGKFVFEGREFSLLFLKDKIKPFLEANQANPVIIYSREAAMVQDVVTAMDYIRVIGGTNVSVAEDSEDAGK